jgi:Rieske Fe-S protein
VSTPTELSGLELSGCAESCTTRRAALAFGAAAGAALLTGCATYGGSSESAADPSEEAAADPSAADDPAAGAPSADDEPDAAETDGAGSGGAASGAAVLAKTSDIPVGSGKIFAKKGVVVTQPTEGTFKAFSTVCTHQGCAVEEVQDGTINCNCHGSKFKITDGSVSDGPANRPLAAKKLTVDGDSLSLA